MLAVLLLGLGLVAALMVRNTLERRAEQQELARRQAERREAIGRMVTRSRRTTDPFKRVALLAGAIGLGSDDSALPLELYSTARELPQVHFMSLQPVRRPQFPWGERWLIGSSSGSQAAVFDFEPLQDTPWGPVTHRFRPHPQGLEEIVAFPFDSSFVTRGLDGQLRVWRLRLSGQIALAAVSPMSCVGGLNAVLVAERAPVLACATAEGIARWDLRQVDRNQLDPFQGRLLHLSADGRWVAAARLSRLLLWNPPDGHRFELRLPKPASLARFSPRDELVAVVRPRPPESDTEPAPVVPPQALAVYGLEGAEPESLLELPTLSDPVQARWDERGLDLAVCNAEGFGRWHYLRDGGRAAQDGPPPAASWPCESPPEGTPARLRHVRDYGELLSGGRRLGPRQYAGGWRLDDGRLLTHDLVLFEPRKSAARKLLEFVGRDRMGLPEITGPGESAVQVVRDGDQVVWQVGQQVHLYHLDGQQLLSRPGHLLRRCANGRLLAWRKKGDDTWELFGVRHEVHVLDVKREPAIFVGADLTCATVFLQRMDGSLAAVDLEERSTEPVALRPLRAAGGFKPDGFVYDVRVSAGSDDAERPLPPGLWLALSSGTMARLEGPEGRLRTYGRATPRPSAMADGPEVGQLLFTDATGVVLRDRETRQDRKVLGAMADVSWEDLQVLDGGTTVLLAAAHRVAALDVERREVVGELETPSRGRLMQWDSGGSLLVWSYGFEGAARGEIVPFSGELAGQVARAVSNLTANLGPRLEVRVELKP